MMNMNDATLPDAHPTMLPGSGSNPAVETAGKRRRPERTPDQIARKRDQDREAQRLSRERTRKRIEDAESRLAESQASIANHERNLHQAIEERYDAQREASDLRKQLESALSQLDSARRHLASMSQLLSANNIQPHSPATTPLESNSLHPLPGPPQLQSPIASESSHSRSPPSHQDVLSIRNMIHRSASPAYMTALENQTIPQAPLQTMSRANISNHSSPSYVTEGSVYGSEGSPGSWADLSTHLPLNGPPTCPMDNILTMFSNSRKELLGQGESEEFVLGPRNPALCVLPSLGMRSNVGLRHPVSQMLAEVLSKVQQVLQPVPEQIAVLWVTHLSLRWNILPNKANWEALPEWLRPVQQQLIVAHPAWIDHIPWPQMRELVTLRSWEFPQEDFFLPYLQGISINWPYDPLDAITTEDGTGQIVVSPAFENHLRNLDNWSLGPVFANAYPSLASTYRHG